MVIFLKFAGAFFLTVNFMYGVLLFLSWRKIKKMSSMSESDSKGPVSFLIPAYNEETLIVETIQTYLSLDVKKEIIVVDDGSHDKTMKLLQIMYQLVKVEDPTGRVFKSILYPELKIISAPRLGKAGALNFGLKFVTYDIVCTMDADTIPTIQGVKACLKAFEEDPKLVACGGVIQVLPSNILKNNSPLKLRAEKWITSFQRLEYLRTFVCERLGWSHLGSTLLISGAFCMLKKETLRKIGGFSPRSITEDFDLIVRLRKVYRGSEHNFRILPVTTCYTQVPSTLRHLSKQRMRWQLGLIQTLFQNGNMFLHPGHGILGMVAVPYFWIVEALSPLIILAGFLVVPYAVIYGLVDYHYVAAFFGLGLVFNLLLTIVGIHLDRTYVSKDNSWSVGRNLLETVLLHFGYKQINNWWRLLATVKSFSKVSSWGENPRVEIIHRS